MDSPGSVVRIVASLRAGRSAVRIRWRLEIFIFSRTSRQAAGPTQSSIQWVPESFPSVTVTTHFHTMPRLRMSGAIPLLPGVPLWDGQGKLNEV
jgi:hypothetical protein